MKLLALALATAATGCLLSSSHGPGNGDDGTGGSGVTPPGGGPVGHVFVADRSQLGNSMCPVFDAENASRQLTIQATSVLVDGKPAANVAVRNTGADEAVDAPNIVFTASEVWVSDAGAASPTISYQLWTIGSSGNGHASANFPFPEAPQGSCAYTWTVSAIE